MEKTSALSVASNPDSLKQHLKEIYTIEKDLYFSTQAVQKMKAKIDALKHNFSWPRRDGFNPLKQYLHSPILRFLQNVLLHLGPIGFSWKLIQNVYIDLTYGMDSISEFLLPPIFALLIGFAISHTIKFLCEKIAQQRYDVAYAKAKVEYEQYIQSVLPPQEATLQLYQQAVASCQEALSAVYGADIIFPKYRTMVAVSQIYEYLCSGRCSTLDGPDGAYNLYESEVRQNIIITHLDKAVKLLADIRDVQYMLVNLIETCTQRLQTIEDNTAAIAFNSATVAYNTNVIARYSG